MTPKLRFGLELAGGLLAILAIGAWHEASLNAAKSDAVQKAQADLQEQYRDQLAALQDQMTQREAHYKQDTEDLQKSFQGSLQQIALLVQRNANLPVPLQIVTPAPTKENPNPTPQVIVPSQDLPAAKTYLLDCEQCKLDRVKLQSDAEDRIKQMTLAQQQIDSLKVQRDAAIKASKGGNWIHRLSHNAKFIAIGGAIGAAAICGSGHCR